MDGKRQIDSIPLKPTDGLTPISCLAVLDPRVRLLLRKGAWGVSTPQASAEIGASGAPSHAGTGRLAPNDKRVGEASRSRRHALVARQISRFLTSLAPWTGNYLLLRMPDGKPQTHPVGKRQRWIAYRRDPLVAGKVVQLGIRGDPGQELVASAQIELGITEVQIAVG